MILNVKIPINLDKEPLNLHKTAYFSSQNECLLGPSKFSIVQCGINPHSYQGSKSALSFIYCAFVHHLDSQLLATNSDLTYGVLGHGFGLDYCELGFGFSFWGLKEEEGVQR